MQFSANEIFSAALAIQFICWWAGLQIKSVNMYFLC